MVEGQYGETREEAYQKANAAAKVRRAAARAAVRKARPKVIDVREDGEDISVEFTRDNGERVVARFSLQGWELPPAELADLFNLPNRPLTAKEKARLQPRPKQAKTPSISMPTGRPRSRSRRASSAGS